MDKYIKMLIIKLSEKYHVTVTTIMFSSDNGRIGNIIKFKLMDKQKEKVIHTKDCNSKRGLISEMMEWASD